MKCRDQASKERSDPNDDGGEEQSAGIVQHRDVEGISQKPAMQAARAPLRQDEPGHSTQRGQY